ncbi:hypothetical protein [Fodinicurvata sediminis]|uniref:hypothetical protein n=1 Tax=Fodinicurvata sediminis TaxID=1121832 RepID=UPI0003B5C582|nr:hypothetical protein [Fodinicurvata sediminis]
MSGHRPGRGPLLVLIVASFFIAGVGLLSLNSYTNLQYAGIESYWGPLLFALIGAGFLVALFISLIIRQNRHSRRNK